MVGHAVLLNLCAGIALLMWATRMVKTGVLRAFGGRVRRTITRATGGPVQACLTGAMLASALQSSSATALMVVSFAERSMIGVPAALALMLGADVGSTLVVQALSFSSSALLPVLLIAGVGTFMMSRSETSRQSGRILIGLALLLLALSMIVMAGKDLRENDVLQLALQRLAGDPILAALLGTVLAWLMHSSVAMVLLAMALADAKKQKQGLQFSPEGWADIEALHVRVVAQMQLALTLLVRPELETARELVAEKDRIRALERAATAAHLERLRQGMPASLDTTSLHLDILRDLKRINAHIVHAAYPILEACGEIRESRLKPKPATPTEEPEAQLRWSPVSGR